MNEFQTLICSGLADLWMAVTKVSDTNSGGKVEQPAAILELSPRSLTPDHDRVAGDPPEPPRNVLGTDVL